MRHSGLNIRPPSLDSFGGLGGLREILTDFYSRVFSDPMIGYLFYNQDSHRLVERELEWTARSLGQDIKYQGKGIAAAHQRHPIRRGHFHRRNQLLEDTIKDHDLPDSCLAWWMAHSQSLEAAILGSAQSDPRCEMTADRSPNGQPTLWIKP